MIKNKAQFDSEKIYDLSIEYNITDVWSTFGQPICDQMVDRSFGLLFVHMWGSLQYTKVMIMWKMWKKVRDRDSQGFKCIDK